MHQGLRGQVIRRKFRVLGGHSSTGRLFFCLVDVAGVGGVGPSALSQKDLPGKAPCLGFRIFHVPIHDLSHLLARGGAHLLWWRSEDVVVEASGVVHGVEGRTRHSQVVDGAVQRLGLKVLSKIRGSQLPSVPSTAPLLVRVVVVVVAVPERHLGRGRGRAAIGLRGHNPGDLTSFEAPASSFACPLEESSEETQIFGHGEMLLSKLRKGVCR
mmetsp:Transcript_33165/g.71124  ORF Transcript_33165/g.71124 Transcript_33165/m.71124 type:complete len:213 (-) Transcript_33165:20-658(-)